MKIVYTAGVWDLLHEGHLNLLKESKKLGDKLVVGVVSDVGAAEYKRWPILDEKQRIAQIQALGMVDLAILQLTTDPTRELEVIKPQIFTHGSDWSELREGNETLKYMDIQYVSIPYYDKVNTTNLIEEIRNRL
jgi:cytidyltransferase-like protein